MAEQEKTVLRTRAKFHGQQIKIGEDIYLRPYYYKDKAWFEIYAPENVTITQCKDGKDGNDPSHVVRGESDQGQDEGQHTENTRDDHGKQERVDSRRGEAQSETRLTDRAGAAVLISAPQLL